MAANVGITKEAFIVQLVSQVGQLLKTAGTSNDELIAYYFANFQGTQAFADSDFAVGGACANQPWLTAAIVTACITTLQAVQTTMSSAQRNNLREVESSPLPLG